MRLYSPHYLHCSNSSPKEIRRRENYISKSISPESQYHAKSTTERGPASHLGMNNDVDTSHKANEYESLKPVFHAPFAEASIPFCHSLSPQQRIKRRQSESLPILSTVATHSISSKRVKQELSFIKTLPQEYELCPVEDVVILISNMIEELVDTNDNLPLGSNVLTRFHSRSPPGITVHDYLQRLAKHATLTPPLLLSMVYYIDRLCDLYPAFTVNSLTVHRFLITAGTVAAKGLSDSFWNNATYARVGGIKLNELCLLESDLLYRLDWRIIPNPEALVDYYKGLVARNKSYTIEGRGITTNCEEDGDSHKCFED